MDVTLVVISVLLAIADGITVHGPSAPLVAPLGSSVVLLCYTDKPLPMEGLEVEWRRTDSETLVHLYQDGESRPEAQHPDYENRAHFFTDQIQHGNFSLRLDNLRAEDEGKYTCIIYSQQDSGETEVQIKDVGITVHSPSAPLVAPLGSSVVLPCYVDKPLPIEDLEVKWRRTDSDADSEADSEIVVHLFLDGESRPESQHQDYENRAHFFTDQIQHGNFSLRLDNLRAEDEGKYTCRVYSQQDSGETEVQIKVVERLLVSGSSRSISAYDGEDVTLSCSVDSHITPEHIEEVSWKKTDGDEDIPVLLYQNNEAFPDSSDEQYRDRVEFFADEIPKGNFSFRLKSVRTEDKGVYMCEVFAGDLSANATVVLEQLGFSSVHIMVLLFCIAASSGAVLLLCCLIYCRSKDTVSSSTIWNLQLSLVFYPNICIVIAFILWGFTEGSLNETITCCALYILRPVMLIWALSYLKYLQDNIKTWTRFFKITTELGVFTVVVYSVLFAYGWRKSAHDTTNDRRVSSGLGFGLVVLSCLLLSTVDLLLPSQEQARAASSRRKARVWFGIIFLPFGQLFQLIFSFGLPSPALLAVPFVQALLLPCIPLLTFLQAQFKFLSRRWITLLWIITISLLDIILVIYIHLTILEKEKDCLEWTSVGVFLEVLRLMAFESRVTVARQKRQRQQTETSQQASNALHLCNEVVYMFGAVGLVLLSSVTLTAELIMKARNGERVMKDLRVVVFPSECVFACWLVLQMHAALKIKTTESTHNQRNTQQRSIRQLGNTAETHEMENLSAPVSPVSL